MKNKNLYNEVLRANHTLEKVVLRTPLVKNIRLSEEYGANIFLKREDLQVVRSYKLRGAYNKIHGLTSDEKKRGVICASAGNHAQGVAYSCSLLNVKGKIVMPVTTPRQKIKQVELFGKTSVEIILAGDTFDDAYDFAMADAGKNGYAFVHPFDDEKVIAGQGTVALEILEDSNDPIDYLFVPVGGGGLAAGVCTVFKNRSPETKIIGVEPKGAPSMTTSLQNGKNTTLKTIDKFVDGAAVKRVGDIPFEICRNHLDDVILVPEGKVCSVILKLYNEQAIVAEPAGALAVAAAGMTRGMIKGKNVVCIVSGSNNDITRTEEIKERSMLYEGVKHYFMVQFPQRPGALKEFVTEVLGKNDDITYFQFAKKNNRESGPAIVGLELKCPDDKAGLFERMREKKIKYRYINETEDLFTQLIG